MQVVKWIVQPPPVFYNTDNYFKIVSIDNINSKAYLFEAFFNLMYLTPITANNLANSTQEIQQFSKGRGICFQTKLFLNFICKRKLLLVDVSMA